MRKNNGIKKLIGKKVAAGRPAGAIGTKSAYARDEICSQFRCSQGFNKTIAELMDTGTYKSKADVLHRALEILAARELPATFYFMGKIQ